ncbi:MAG: GNAT family N-acetyltransferase [Phycisphaerales bacterium JB040]
MAMGVSVRVMTPGECVNACAEMLSRVLMQTEASVLLEGLEHRDPGAVPLAGLCLSPGHELLVAEYSMTPVGMARVRTSPGRASGAASWYCEPRVVAFDLLMVEPAMRGLGIGATLLEALAVRAGTHGADELSCDLPIAAADEIAWLRRHGFRPVERVERTTRTRVVLSRTLDADALQRAA